MKQIKRAVRLRATRVQHIQMTDIESRFFKQGIVDIGVLELGDGVTEIIGYADDVCNLLDVILREVYGMSYEDILNPDHDEWHPLISDHMSFSVTAKQKHSRGR